MAVQVGFRNDANTLLLIHGWERDHDTSPMVDHGPYSVNIPLLPAGAGVRNGRGTWGTGPRNLNSTSGMGFKSDALPSAIKNALCNGPWTIEFTCNVQGMNTPTGIPFEFAVDDAARYPFTFAMVNAGDGNGNVPAVYWTTNDASPASSPVSQQLTTQTEFWYVWGNVGQMSCTYYTALTYEVSGGVATLKLYVNRQLMKTITGAPIDAAQAARNIYLGFTTGVSGTNGRFSFAGTIGDFRFSNKVRDASEMLQAEDDCFSASGKMREHWAMEPQALSIPVILGTLTDTGQPFTDNQNGYDYDLSNRDSNVPGTGQRWPRITGNTSYYGYATGPGGCIGRWYKSTGSGTGSGALHGVGSGSNALSVAVGGTKPLGLTLDLIVKQSALTGIVDDDHFLLDFNNDANTGRLFSLTIQSDGRVKVHIVTSTGATAGGTFDLLTTNPVFPLANYVQLKVHLDFLAGEIRLYMADLGNDRVDYTPGPLTLLETWSITGTWRSPNQTGGSGSEQIIHWYAGAYDGSAMDYLGQHRIEMGMNMGVWPAIGGGVTPPEGPTFTVGFLSGRVQITFSEAVLDSTVLRDISHYTMGLPAHADVISFTDVRVESDTVVSLGISAVPTDEGDYTVTVDENTARSTATGAGNDVGGGTWLTVAAVDLALANPATEYIDSTHIRVFFNKKVKQGVGGAPDSLTPSNYLIFPLDSDQILDVDQVDAVDARTVVLTLANPADPVEYRLGVQNVEDLNGATFPAP